MDCSSITPEPGRDTPATNRLPATRFWQTASGFWRGPRASLAWLLTGALLASTLVQLVLQVRLNYWSRDFFDAFGRRDGSALWDQALLFLLLAGMSILVAVSSMWARMTFQRNWRAWLTRHLIGRWLGRSRLPPLLFEQGEDRNPEYRIAEDARVATDAPVSMAAGLLTAVLNVIIFIGILWNVGGDLIVDVRGHVLTVPKYLVITVVIYSLLLTLAMALIGRRMTRVIAGKNAAEAEFRSVGSSLRERGVHASGPDQAMDAQRQLSGALDVTIDRWRELCRQFMRTTVVSHGNILAAPIVGWALCAPKYLVGTMSLGEAAQAVAAFVMVQAALNWLVDNYPGLAECVSSINRVASLLLALDKVDQKHGDR